MDLATGSESRLEMEWQVVHLNSQLQLPFKKLPLYLKYLIILQ